MKVILLCDVKGTGKKDDVLNVSDGFARNYLFPRKWAVEATPGAVKEIERKRANEERLERERREAILRAEGEKKSAILTAEGEKESAILRADAKKQAQILEAQGEAEAILTVQRATAEGIKLINEATPTDPVIKLKALEAFAAAANGRATKIIIPSEIQGLAGLAEGIVEAVKLPEKPAAKQDSN